MSIRKGAPYADRVEEDGRILVYEGHDVVRVREGPDPKSVDQPFTTPNGTVTQNGLFATAADDFKKGQREAELVRVYEKLRSGIWVYNGTFRLVDAWTEVSNGRKVFKFRLTLTDASSPIPSSVKEELAHARLIPGSVKLRSLET